MIRGRSLIAVLVAVVALALPLALFTATPAAAHDAPTRGYSRITAEGDTLTWTLYFDPHHLDSFMRLDADANGTVSGAEVDARHRDIADLVLPDVSTIDVKTNERPTGRIGTVGLVEFKTTGLHSEGFAQLDDFPLVAVPVAFGFNRLDTQHVQLTYNLFVVEAFGEHVNIAEVDIAGSSKVFQFDPGIPTVVIGAVFDGTAPSDSGRPTSASDATGANAGDTATAPSTKGSDGRNLAPLWLALVTLAFALGFGLRQHRTGRHPPGSPDEEQTPVALDVDQLVGQP